MNFSPFITVAASNSKFNEKDGIDFVCSWKNDELVINEAIKVASEEGKSVYLLNGVYHIDDFYDFEDGGPLSAIRTPALYKEIAIIGQSFNFSQNLEGVQFDVSEEAHSDNVKAALEVLEKYYVLKKD